MKKMPFLLSTFLAAAAANVFAAPPEDVKFIGPSLAPISTAVSIPAGRALFLTSGTVAQVIADDKILAEAPNRFGDTRTQGISALRQIEARLKEAGLGFKDVVYLRAYLTADKNNGGKFDYVGWFEAYSQFFNTADNPIKPARSSVGVASLVDPDWLIEIEAVAVYPVP